MNPTRRGHTKAPRRQRPLGDDRSSEAALRLAKMPGPVVIKLELQEEPCTDVQEEVIEGSATRRAEALASIS